jgi:hypothetical protein
MELEHHERLRWVSELARINTTLNDMTGQDGF